MIRLKQVAHARSGDKGNHANIGVVAYTAEGYAFLGRELTAGRVAAWARGLWPEPGAGGPARAGEAEGPRRVERYSLPGIRAYNFVLRDVLGGGASDSPRTDTQGKVLATALLELGLPDPPDPRALGPEEGP